MLAFPDAHGFPPLALPCAPGPGSCGPGPGGAGHSGRGGRRGVRWAAHAAVAHGAQLSAGAGRVPAGALLARPTDYHRVACTRLLGAVPVSGEPAPGPADGPSGRNPDCFYTALPYAYVFGLADVWAEAFAGLCRHAPVWYTGGYQDFPPRRLWPRSASAWRRRWPKTTNNRGFCMDELFSLRGRTAADRRRPRHRVSIGLALARAGRRWCSTAAGPTTGTRACAPIGTQALRPGAMWRT